MDNDNDNIIPVDFKNRIKQIKENLSGKEDQKQESQEVNEERRWTAQDALTEALKAEVDEVVIIGVKRDEGIFYNASLRSGRTGIFLLEYAKFIMGHSIFNGKT